MVTIKLTDSQCIALRECIESEINTLENCDPAAAEDTIQILGRISEVIYKAQMKEPFAELPKIFILQEETGGIPYEPMVFHDEKEAVKAYVKIVNENHQTKYKRFGAASRHAERANESGDDWFIRLWEI